MMMAAARLGSSATRTPWERGFLKWMRDGGIDARDFFTFVPEVRRYVNKNPVEPSEKDTAARQRRERRTDTEVVPMAVGSIPSGS